MESNWAVENLQTIRTLMERSALYRRALAPSMLSTGVIGVAGAGIGHLVPFDTGIRFMCFWCVICMLAAGVSFLIIRRQAVKEAEPFWTPPTRSVAMALSAPFFAAAVLSTVLAMQVTEGKDEGFINPILVSFWLTFYGCGLCAASFFVSRGVRVLGWLFVLCGAVVFTQFLSAVRGKSSGLFDPYMVMALTFGGLHLASGIYLYFTEKRKNAA